MDPTTLNRNAGRVAAIFSAVATIIIILGLVAIVAGFIQAVADTDDTLTGVFAGILVAVAIALYVAVSWAGVQLAALIAGYIQVRTGGDAR